MTHKKKKDFVSVLTSPFTGKSFVTVKDGQKFFSLPEARRIARKQTKRFGKSARVTVKKVSPFGKSMRKLFNL